jgi:hypothetical protein
MIIVKFEEVKTPNVEESDGKCQEVEYVRNLEPKAHGTPTALEL